jgi:hypothetical protein
LEIETSLKVLHFVVLLGGFFMALSPVDKGQEFIQSGMVLITDPASDKLLNKVKQKKYEVPEDRYSRPCGGAGGFDDFVERWHE